MPKRITIELSQSQQQELKHIRDHHPKPYLCERAAAILKIASGYTLTEIAERGLLSRHEPETVHLWVKKYLSSGFEALSIKPGGGRKPKFSPSMNSNCAKLSMTISINLLAYSSLIAVDGGLTGSDVRFLP